MKLIALEGLPRLHKTPLGSVRVEKAGVFVEVDDEHEERIQFVLRPYQAVRMTTADCFTLPPGVCILPQVICEIANSEWIADLKRRLALVDETATFLTKAHHYIFPLQDDFLEVVAWGIDMNSNVTMSK